MVALLLAALLQGTAPVSSFTAPNTPPAKSAGQPDKDGIVCRKEAVVGSRMKQKICERPSETRQRALDDRDMADKAQTLQTIRDPSLGPPM